MDQLIYCVYAPTLTAPDDTKDDFCSQLDTIIKEFPKQEDLVILGSFHAHIGSDNEAWPNWLSHLGVGKCNENGQQLLEHCSYHELCITNTFFGTKPHHRVYRRHQRSKHWHQIDLILMRQTHPKNFLVTRTYHSVDCDTNHSLMCCRVKLQPKKFHHNKQERKPRFDVSKTQHSDHLAEFKTQFSSAFVGDYNLPSTAQWENVKNVTILTALSAFGKRKGSQQNDWYHSNSPRLDPFIEADHTAGQAYKDMPSPATLNTLQSARSDVQKEVRACINESWTDLCRTIQQAADTGNVKGMQNGIKKATGPSIKNSIFKSKSGEFTNDKVKQLDTWVEHYSELYSMENVVHQSALDEINHLPLMPEQDEVPSIEELSKAIDRLPSGKGPGKDGILAEVIKSSKSTLLVPLHKLLTQCWKEGSEPQDMRIPTSLLSTRIRAIVVTVTTTVASHC